jgi:hypothetical protein
MSLSSITSGLNSAANQLGSLTQNSTSSATTLPSWYDTAQQNLVNSATANAGNVPQLQNTVAGQAINQLSGSNNPFTQAQSTLGTIASGAANPWITNADGTITPNTNTALGGLAASEQQALNNTLPQLASQTGAGGTATGQFGSLRGQTAQQNAYGNALNTMNTALNTAALNNQATGVNAATGQSTSGAQGTAAETTLGQAQQASPLTSTAQLANILGTIQAPTTVTNTTNESPLSVLQQGQSLLSSMANAGGLSGISSSLGSLLSNAINGNSLPTGVPAGSTLNSSGLYTAPDGSTYSSTGAWVSGSNTSSPAGVTGNTGTLDQQNQAQSGDSNSNVEQTGT